VARRKIKPVAVDKFHRVTEFELFFDLVFVFAMTQVTSYLAAHLTGRGVFEAMLLLALLWWCWVGYSWLGAVVRADEGLFLRGLIAVAMAALLVFSIAVPEAFHDIPGGYDGPLVVALCVIVVRVVHIGLFWFAAQTDRGLKRQLALFMLPSATGALLLVVAAIVPDSWMRIALFAGAVCADLLLNQLIGATGWRLHAPGHFAERHGLIIIIALGESLVSIGVGVQDRPTTGPIVLAAVLGLLVITMLWWAYFDVVAPAAERVLARLTGEQRSRLARDSYSYLHLPMVAGIVLLALGLKKTLLGLGDHGVDTALKGVAAWALFVGPALYLLGLVGFRLRVMRSWNVPRVVVAVLLCVAAPLVGVVSALTALGVLAVVLVVLIIFEVWVFSDRRAEIRHEIVEHR
jgi:low temperature requirement protein LtrA